MSNTDAESERATRHYLWVTNAEGTPIVLCVEPWANELPVLRGNNYMVVFEGPEGQVPEVEWRKDRITVYGWSGSVAWVLLNGEILLSCTKKVPKVPVR